MIPPGIFVAVGALLPSIAVRPILIGVSRINRRSI